jgi:NADPH-dependent glutamate synthase beta subunit-like oxidoreductase
LVIKNGLGGMVYRLEEPTFHRGFIQNGISSEGLLEFNTISVLNTSQMTSKIKRVAVIGAGPSGGIAVDALAKEQAFDVIRVFERKAKAGGTW